MLKNLLSIFTADLAGRILGVFATIYLGRVLGVEPFGTLNFAFAIAGYFLIPVDFGFNEYGILRVAPNRDRGFLGGTLAGVLVVRVALAAIGLTALWIVTSQVERLREIQPLILVAGLLLVVHAVGTDWVFTALERMTTLAAARFAGSLLYLPAIVLLVHSSEDLLIAAGLQVGREAAVASILLAAVAWKIRPILTGVRELQWREMLRTVFPIGISGALSQLHGNFDLVLLGFLVAGRDVGWYAAALHIVGAAMVVRRALIQVAMPRLARAAGDSTRMIQVASMLQKHTIPVGLFAGTAGSLFAGGLIEKAYGAEYSGATLALQIGIWRVAIDLFGLVFLTTLFVRDRIRYAKIYGVATVANVLFNLALIPWLGIAGAAWAYVASTAVLFVLCRHAVHRLGYPVPTLRWCALPSGAALAMTAVALVSGRLGFWVQASLASAAFLSVLLLGGLTLRQLQTDLGDPS